MLSPITATGAPRGGTSNAGCRLPDQAEIIKNDTYPEVIDSGLGSLQCLGHPGLACEPHSEEDEEEQEEALLSSASDRPMDEQQQARSSIGYADAHLANELHAKAPALVSGGAVLRQ